MTLNKAVDHSRSAYPAPQFLKKKNHQNTDPKAEFIPNQTGYQDSKLCSAQPFKDTK